MHQSVAEMEYHAMRHGAVISGHLEIVQSEAFGLLYWIDNVNVSRPAFVKAFILARYRVA